MDAVGVKGKKRECDTCNVVCVRLRHNRANVKGTLAFLDCTG